MEKMKWSEAISYLREYNRKHKYRCGGPNIDKHCVMVAVVKPEAMIDPNANEARRTYVFNNENKALLDGMGGYSIFAQNQGTKYLERIEGFSDNIVEYCYIKSED